MISFFSTPCIYALNHSQDLFLPDRHVIGVDLFHLHMNSFIPTIDYFCHWPEAFGMPDIKSDIIPWTLFSSWLGRISIPSVIITDCGKQFEAELCFFFHLTNLLSSSHLYYPECNVKHFQYPLKTALKVWLDQIYWLDKLSLVILYYRPYRLYLSNQIPLYIYRPYDHRV